MDKNINKCKICKTKTDNTFSVNFKIVFICKRCANQITLQQVKDLILG